MTALAVDIEERVVVQRVPTRIDDPALRSQGAQAEVALAHAAAAGRQVESQVALAEATLV